MNGFSGTAEAVNRDPIRYPLIRFPLRSLQGSARRHSLTLPLTPRCDLYRWGAAIGCDAVCYVTIGTGVGGGLLLDGKPVHGAMHPEIGHLRLRRAAGDQFAGTCPFHGDCIEGLVSGPALAARFGQPAETIPDDHPTWALVAQDLAELVGAILLTHSADRILLGGSVILSRPFLLPIIRSSAVARLGSYLPFLDAAGADATIRLAGLGPDAGPLGAIALAQRAALAGD